MNTQILIFTAIIAGVVALGIIAWALVRNRANRLESEVRKQADHNKAIIDATNIAVSLVNLAGRHEPIRALPPGRRVPPDLSSINVPLKDSDGAVRAATD